MPPDGSSHSRYRAIRADWRAQRWVAWLLLPLGLAACATTSVPRPADNGPQAAAPQPDRDAAMAMVLADTIQSVQRLAQSGPSEQAEQLAGARAAAERSPQGSAQLRYALMLGVPGTVSRDPERAQMLLRQLAAQQEGLTPVERALLLIQLSQLDRELGLRSDNQRLQTESQRSERERQVVANQRLQTEIAENAKLRKQLDEAQAKLDAIAQIERSLNERQGNTEGRKP